MTVLKLSYFGHAKIQPLKKKLLRIGKGKKKAICNELYRCVWATPRDSLERTRDRLSWGPWDGQLYIIHLLIFHSLYSLHIPLNPSVCINTKSFKFSFILFPVYFFELSQIIIMTFFSTIKISLIMRLKME